MPILRCGSQWNSSSYFHLSLISFLCFILQGEICHRWAAAAAASFVSSGGLHILSLSFNRPVQDRSLRAPAMHLVVQIYELELKSPPRLVPVAGSSREIVIIFSNQSKAVWLGRLNPFAGRSVCGGEGEGGRHQGSVRLPWHYFRSDPHWDP